jgi:hypothetical protein
VRRATNLTLYVPAVKADRSPIVQVQTTFGRAAAPVMPAALVWTSFPFFLVMNSNVNVHPIEKSITVPSASNQWKGKEGSS